MTTTGLNRTARREREILDAAAKLFSERGYSSTTIRDIGAAAGLNHATTNYYFRGKAAVLFAIYQDALDGFFAGLDGVSGPPDEALAQVVRIAVAAAVHRKDETAVYFQELRWLEQLLPPDMAAIVRERQQRFRARVCEIVEDGIAQGRFRPIDPLIAAEAVVAMARWAYQTGAFPEAGSVSEAADECARFVVNGLLP
jgi:TetR/AcrR family transcriptional regulator, cholesterol catabolism regulator